MATMTPLMLALATAGNFAGRNKAAITMNREDSAKSATHVLCHVNPSFVP